MEQDEGEEHRGIVGKIADAVKSADIERGLMNQAAAMPGAGGDLNFAADSPASGPAGMVPGAGAAAGGSLTDQEPVGRGEDPDVEAGRDF